MQRKKYIVGNWKMYKTAENAFSDFSILKNNLNTKSHNNDVGICAPSVFLSQLAENKDNIRIYAQNVYWENEGAFTGEISVPMLKSIQVDGSLVAHSERRQYFHETNLEAGKKLHALLKNEMSAIYCVGESLQEREGGKVQAVIETQLCEALELCKEEIKLVASNTSHDEFNHLPNVDNFKIYSPLAIAYEPVWAIGTGKAATVQDARTVHVFIRSILTKMFGIQIANNTRILYGGSVKLSNAKEFLSDDEIDGALVGGASLIQKIFLNCVR